MKPEDVKFHESIRTSLSNKEASFSEDSWEKLAPKLMAQNASSHKGSTSIWKRGTIALAGVLVMGYCYYYLKSEKEPVEHPQKIIQPIDTTKKIIASKKPTEPVLYKKESTLEVEPKKEISKQRVKPKKKISKKVIIPTVKKEKIKVDPEIELEEPLTIVNENTNAKPIIGFQRLYQYFADSIKYPNELKIKEASGKIQVSFSVSKTGEISKIKVISSTHESLNQEAIRVVNEMPDWSPKIFNNKAIGSRVIMPISFSFVASPKN